VVNSCLFPWHRAPPEFFYHEGTKTRRNTKKKILVFENNPVEFDFFASSRFSGAARAWSPPDVALWPLPVRAEF
jgi:hypothetical protein